GLALSGQDAPDRDHDGRLAIARDQRPERLEPISTPLDHTPPLADLTVEGRGRHTCRATADGDLTGTLGSSRSRRSGEPHSGSDGRGLAGDQPAVRVTPPRSVVATTLVSRETTSNGV